MNRLGIVTGLKSESALILRVLGEALMRPPVMVQCRGPGPDHAAQAADMLVSAGCTALMSMGIAGGLAAHVTTGTVLLPRTVVRLPASDTSHGITVDAHWHMALMSRFKHDLSYRVSAGPLVTSTQPLTTAADKAGLHELLGAVGVDMESHAVAEVAARAGLPFVALRVVADPASQPIPASLKAAMTDDGDVDMLRGVLAVLRAPWLLGDARRLKRYHEAALKMMEKLLRSDLLARAFLMSIVQE